MNRPLPDQDSIHSALLAVLDAQAQTADLLHMLRLTLEVCRVVAPSLGDLGEEDLSEGLALVEEAKRKLEEALTQADQANPGSETRLLLNRLCRP